MIENMDRLLIEADKIAEKAHRGQVDKCGRPYIEHPRAVADMVDTKHDKIVALLHDVIEDTAMTEYDLRPVFGEDITSTLVLLTHKKGVPYLHYIKGLCANETAVRVKIADLRHNMDPRRVPSDHEWYFRRLKNKYEPAFQLLTDYLEMKKGT